MSASTLSISRVSGPRTLRFFGSKNKERHSIPIFLLVLSFHCGRRSDLAENDAVVEGREMAGDDTDSTCSRHFDIHSRLSADSDRASVLLQAMFRSIGISLCCFRYQIRRPNLPD